VVAGQLAHAFHDGCEPAIVEIEGVLDSALSAKGEVNRGAFDLDMPVAERGQAIRAILDLVGSIADADHRNIEQPDNRCQHLLQRQTGTAKIALDLFANYTGKYRNWIQTSVIPVELGPNGNPVGGGDPVRSDLTFDLHAAYTFKGDFMTDSQIYIDVKNLFDRNPPFYNGNTTGAGGVGAWGFNGFTSNLLGRIVAVGFRANF